MGNYIVKRTSCGAPFSLIDLEGCLNSGYSITTVNRFGDGLEYVLKKDAIENKDNVSEELYMKLVEKYIKETADVDGKLFCGCREEDCTDHMHYSECRKCLERYLKENID